jgi:peptide/nickel transport system substrate-binding protein
MAKRKPLEAGRKSMRRFGRFTLALVASSAIATSVMAGDLVMGRSSPQSVLDPLYTVQPTGVAAAPDIFDRLVTFGLDLQLKPGLALSWTAIDALTWELKLRPGVTFHNGAPFGAKDVVASFKRAASMPNSPSPMAVNVAAVERTEIVDPLTIRVRTKVPTPLLMDQIGQIYIVPADIAEAPTSDFNNGKLVIGTGPYKFKSWIPNEEIKLVANPDWWGGKPEFDNVTLKFIADSSSRVAALLSGQVDVIDAVPPADIGALKARPDINLFSIPSVRLLYFHLDLANDSSPYIADLDGKPLDKNPLKDQRVRKALSLLIDRTAISQRILSGNAAPAGQVAVKGQGGYSDALPPDPYDPKKAKDLLTAAGYPNGFAVTLHCAVDRDVNSPQVLQAVAQMFSRGGIKVNSVDCVPYSVFSTAATRGEYSVFLWGRNDSTSDTSLNLRNGYMTFNEKEGFGSFNRGRYSNPAFDDLVKAALQELDQAKRYALLTKATEVMIGDMAVVPVYFLNATWATRKGFSYEANMAANTGVQYVHPAAK